MIYKNTDEKIAQYKLLEDSFDGTGGYVDGTYLFQYDREVDYTTRQQMAYYVNYMRPIIDAKVAPVFSTPPQREYTINDGGLLDAFLSDATNNSDSLESVIYKATLKTTLLGNSFIVMDNFPEEMLTDSLQDTIANRAFPYVYVLSPKNVYSYEVDDWHNLVSFTFFWREEKNNYETIKYYKRMTKDAIEIVVIDSDKIKVIRRTEHNFNAVPVVYFNQDVLPFSEYYPMSTLARTIYNNSAEVVDLFRSSAFSILTLPTRNPSGDTQNDIVVGSKNALLYDADSSHEPAYISPDSAILSNSVEYSKALINQLIQSADVLGTTAISNNNGATSGIAESYKFFGKQQALMISSKIANTLETLVVRLFGLYTNNNYDDYAVKYRENFTPTFTDYKNKLEALEKVAQMDISDNVTYNIYADIVDIVADVMKWEDERLSSVKDSIVVDSALSYSDSSVDEQEQ